MSQMVFYKYPLDESEVYDGSPIGSTYAYGIANTELFDTVPDDVEIVLDDETSDWYALSNGTVVSGPYASVDEAFESIASTYGADDWIESDEGYDEAQSELTVASFDGIPVTAREIYAARTEYGVDVDLRTRTVAGRRADIARWRMDMAERTRTASTRTAAQAGWLELEPDLWEYQDGREQAYIMDANDGLLHLYYEGLDYGPYEDEYMAMEVFSTILPPIDEAIDRALAIDPGDRPYIDGDDTGNGMLDDDWEDDFDADEFDPDDDWGFHDVSDLDDDYDDEDDSRTASVHRAFDEDEFDDELSYISDDTPVTHLPDDEGERTASVHTAGAWTIDADAPLDNDQKRMLNDAGVAFSQDETDDGKARITLTGTDKVVADTAEMIGLTDDFVNDAEPLDGSDQDDDEEDETPEEETRRDIEEAVESDDMHEVSDEDQQRIVDGVTDLLEGWKNEVADRSASRTAEAPGADGTDVSELPVDEDWPYVLNSRKVDVDNGRYVSTHEASSDDDDCDSEDDHEEDDTSRDAAYHDHEQQSESDHVNTLSRTRRQVKRDHGQDCDCPECTDDGWTQGELDLDEHGESTREASVRMAADSYYDEDLGGYPLAVDEDGGETEFDNQRDFEDGPLDFYYYQVFERYGDTRKDIIDAIDDALSGAATLDITYPEVKDENIYLSTYGEVFSCSECDKHFRDMDEAMRHLREEARRALGDVDSDRTASTRTAHSLTEISVLDDNGEPVSISITMDKDYETEHANYTFESDRNDIYIDDFWGEIDPEAYDDEREYMWTFGSDTDGQLYGGSTETFEEAEEALYSSAQEYLTLYVPDVLKEAREIADEDLR